MIPGSLQARCLRSLAQRLATCAGAATIAWCSACTALSPTPRPSIAEEAGAPALLPATELTFGVSGGGYSGGDEESSIQFLDVGYQFPVNLNVTWGARVVVAHEDYTETGDIGGGGNSKETGEATAVGVGADVRYYPGVVFDGVYGGIGFIFFPYNDGEYEYRDFDTNGAVTYQEQGDYDISSVGYLTLGYTFRLSSATSLGLELVGAAGESFITTLGLRLGVGG